MEKVTVLDLNNKYIDDSHLFINHHFKNHCKGTMNYVKKSIRI